MHELLRWFNSNGLLVDKPILDSEFHNVPTIDRPNKKTGWYVGKTNENGVTICTAGDFRSGKKFTFCSKKSGYDFKNDIKILINKSRDEIKKRNQNAAIKAQKLWGDAKEAKTHDYLSKKKISACGAKILDGKLLVPMSSTFGLVGLQTINQNGQKRFLFGQQTKEAFFVIGHPTDEIFICEGYATGATIYEATKCMVFVAFSASNLMAVAKIVRNKYPDKQITIAADNDDPEHKKKYNAGMTAAKNAASIIRSQMVWPSGIKGTDFNDMLIETNIEKVRSVLLAKWHLKIDWRWKPFETIEMFEHIKEIISGNDPYFPPFPTKMVTIENENGSRLIYEELTDKVLSLRHADFFTTKILKYINEIIPNVYMMNLQMAENCAEYIKMRLDPIQSSQVKLVREKSEDGYTFCRLPWDFNIPVDSSKTPTFNRLFSRIGNSDALKAWIGSLFDCDSDRSQYPWLFGRGGDGKSKLVEFLQRVFQNGLVSENASVNRDKFWTLGVHKARIVAFTDCQDPEIIHQGVIKSLTGGDRIRFEEKGGAIFNDDVNCKLMFLSNERPKINSSNADLRRVIFCEFEPIPDNEQKISPKIFAELLWSEGQYFLAECAEKYKQLSKDSGVISLDSSIAQDLADSNEGFLQSVFDNYFVTGSETDYVIPKRMHEIIMADKTLSKIRDGHEKFKRFMQNKYNIRLTRGHRTERRYVGLRELTQDENNIVYIKSLGALNFHHNLDSIDPEIIREAKDVAESYISKRLRGLDKNKAKIFVG